VHVITDGKETDISINQVQVGNILIVKPGEKIPVDGKIIDGSSHVDESTITGESMPAEKRKDDLVYAGTINQKGSFYFEAQKVGTETMLAKIISAVQQAQGSKAPVQKLVDKIAGIFVPVVISIALVTFICWMVAGGENAITHALLTSISVLVIACPCALGLATPTAIMVGIGKGAENNILIKDAESLERGSRVNAVVLDKTGTITEGKPEVVDELWSVNLKELQYYRNVLFTLEKQSEHPLSQAIVNKMMQENAQSLELRDFVSITGRGVSAIVNGQLFVAGNKRLMDERNILLPVNIISEVGRWQQNAGTVIYFANDQEVAGAFVVADKIKQTSHEAIKTLHDRRIEVFMLTGDSEQTASSVARQVGIKQYRSEFLPADKAAFIEELQHKGKIVAMAGDGINDSQALALADVSIAMGKGSDIAMDVAAITLITSDLRAIPKSFSLSRKTVRGIRQNLFWAFIYNLVGIPIAAGILYPVNGFLLDPMIAGAAMALSSVSVVLNSLRLRTITIN
jgi:Cu2+-exporting ATPase